jgi:iron complex transport system ATP-binding protein
VDRDHDAAENDVMTPLLEARGVAIDGRLEPSDLAVGEGELVAVIGPNGGGKTSLLRALAGIETSDGTVCVDCENLASVPPARRPRLATFLPASRDLPWPIGARDVIALGLPVPDPDRVDELLGLFELRSLGERPVDRLSTGERTRVLLARALAPSPRMLLLDEPLSNLDPYWVLKVIEILRDAVAAGASALVALHDIDRVTAFDRALLIEKGAIRTDLDPSEMLASAALADAFRIERAEGGWRVRPPADRRSSP